jgi:ketosteroid isomerase-like protein
MSSQGLTAENVVRSCLNCLATGDVAGILALHTEDSVIDMPGTGALPWAGRWVGIEKIREYFHVMPSVPEIRSHTQRLWVVDGNKVVVTGNEVAACRKTGKDYRQSGAGYSRSAMERSRSGTPMRTPKRCSIAVRGANECQGRGTELAYGKWSQRDGSKQCGDAKGGTAVPRWTVSNSSMKQRATTGTRNILSGHDSPAKRRAKDAF